MGQNASRPRHAPGNVCGACHVSSIDEKLCTVAVTSTGAAVGDAATVVAVCTGDKGPGPCAVAADRATE